MYYLLMLLVHTAMNRQNKGKYSTNLFILNKLFQVKFPHFYQHKTMDGFNSMFYIVMYSYSVSIVLPLHLSQNTLWAVNVWTNTDTV